ncbi:armadillo repeat-containing protein gudu-like [Cimex lectularius]|uniref:Armadillo repeat-containing protein gudu n=1 Tax=Cimex lectularius TaxID=79782 RepID=A0A8I6RDW5_CIMLE|nr:armadillo repeat-containing protein gudu-like [Cimex lectularius]
MSDSDSEESDSLDQEKWHDDTTTNKSDLPSEYWHLQKLLKYIKVGNQTATIIALACMKDLDLNSDIALLAIKDIGGLEILINLLETNVHKCVLGSLQVLESVSEKNDVKKELTELGAVPLLVGLLKSSEPQLQSLAATTISYLATTSKARNLVRHAGGIPILVDLLDVPKSFLTTPTSSLTDAEQKILNIVTGSGKALWALSLSRRNKELMRKAGLVSILARFLSSVHEDILLYTLGTIDECSSERCYQLDIQSESMIGDMVRFLSAENALLKKHCASAIFKCAEDEHTRRLVREFGGLEPLVELISKEENKEDKALLSAATGAIWKCAKSIDNVRRLDQLDIITVLVELLKDEDEQVLKNVAGALAECAKLQHNRDNIGKSGGIEALVSLLNLTNRALLENVTKVLGECGNEVECMAKIEELDGVRLIWSLLKNKSPRVQASAAWALVPCISNSNDCGETVRSLVGGLELIVSLLKSKDKAVLASVCAALAHIAQDQDNLAVITDHGVVPLLCNLVHAEEDDLREHLAMAIAQCCKWGNNCFEFGRLGAVAPLVTYMGSKERRVHRTTALALNNISQDPFNCVTLHHSGVVPYLLQTISSSDESLQEASAGCLSNIRKLALAVDHLSRL